jgi:hypothetical protein
MISDRDALTKDKVLQSWTGRSAAQKHNTAVSSAALHSAGIE